MRFSVNRLARNENTTYKYYHPPLATQDADAGRYCTCYQVALSSPEFATCDEIRTRSWQAVVCEHHHATTVVDLPTGWQLFEHWARGVH